MQAVPLGVSVRGVTPAAVQGTVIHQRGLSLQQEALREAVLSDDGSWDLSAWTRSEALQAVRVLGGCSRVNLPEKKVQRPAGEGAPCVPLWLPGPSCGLKEPALRGPGTTWR